MADQTPGADRVHHGDDPPPPEERANEGPAPNAP